MISTNLLYIVIGLIVLVWSADRFVQGAVVVADTFKIPPLLIGILIIGFGTSAPEIVVSILAAINNTPGIALGNAYGSNIANISLILGITALISPVIVQPEVLKKELLILIGFTFLTIGLLWDLELSRYDAYLLLGAFGLFIITSIVTAKKEQSDATPPEWSLTKAIVWTAVGLILLIISSRLLVYGAVNVATQLGVSNLVIGLTIIAIGTSLPELASSIVAARKGEHELVFGNIIGSNLFNTMVVVGLAGVIQPVVVDQTIVTRDLSFITLLTLSLLVMGYHYGRSKTGRINRWEGGLLLLSYIAYSLYLISTVTTT